MNTAEPGEEPSKSKVPSKSPMGRIGKGLGASWVGQGTNVLSRLLEVPLAIAFWGVDTYGIWLILNVIPTLLNASDFGIGTVIDRVMAREMSEGHREATVVSFQTALVITLLSSLSFSLLTLAAFATGAMQPLIGLGNEPISLTVTVVALLALRVVVQMVYRISQAGLFCVGEYPRAFLLSGIGDLFIFGAFFLAVVQGGGLIAAAAAQLFAAVVVAVVLQLQVHRFAPWLTMGVRHFSRVKLNEMATPALATFSLSISRSVNYSLPRILVSVYGGPAAATVFHAHRQLARLINFMLLFGRPFQAEIALTYRGEKEQSFVDLAERTVQLFVWISFGSALAVSILAVLIFPYWTHGAVAFEPLLFALLTLTSLLEALGTSALLPIAGINRHISVAWTFVLANTIGLLVAIPLTGAFGINGMASALLFVDAVTCVRTYPMLAKILHDQTWHVVTRVAMPPLWLIPIIKKMILGRGWPGGTPGSGA